ncbi:hypothetical protein LAZ67_X004505 [Cordylochernes scorpioides]|uniref:Uncharacterized protein n=1 Tax=Cordylochernes scorpioides TaxID=51811 RepID=A0ABY6LUY7_9ARAC|nr:hypothetical protein LAZ67_X004505 [Cordylochernes scorpioides]
MILVKDAQNFKGLMKMCKIITDLIKENPRTTLLELEQDTGISKTTIGRIVTEDLKLKKTPAKFIPRFLTNEQKLCRLATCEDMMEMTRTDPEWKDKIITGDETWVYGYDPETKPQSAEWRGSQENIITISTKLKAFKEKLSLWNLNIAKENFASFPMAQENPSKSIIKKEVEETLTLLSASFDKYFPYLDVEKMEWVVNPFMHCEIQHLEEEMQENLIDLKTI